MSAEISALQLESHAAASRLMGITSCQFHGAHALAQLRQLPGAEYRYELKISNGVHEFTEWCSVEVGGVRYSVCCINDASPKQAPAEGSGGEPRKLKSVP